MSCMVTRGVKPEPGECWIPLIDEKTWKMIIKKLNKKAKDISICDRCALKELMIMMGETAVG